MKKVLVLLLACTLLFTCSCSSGGIVVSSDLASSAPAKQESLETEISSINSQEESSETETSSVSSQKESSETETSSVSSQKESSETETSSVTTSNTASQPKVNTEHISKNYLAKITPQKVALSSATSKTAAEFSYELFKNSYASGQNALISPISALSALSMAANGADGETLSQMEAALGTDKDTLNTYLYSYRKSLLGDSFALAQSVWLKDTINPSDEFMQANADYHDVDVFSVPMDNSTVDKINSWTKNKTKGEIAKLINELPANTTFCLVNAAVFDSKWKISYKDSQIRSLPFHNADASQTKTQFLYSREDFYFSGEGYCGFVKPYTDDRYAFAAFLPDYNYSLDSLVNSLDGNGFVNAITTAEKTPVAVYLPTFTNEFETDLIPILRGMGMKQAFDPSSADFSKIYKSCWISQVKQKAKIEVSREGTKAAAATVIVAPTKSANGTGNIKSVNLNRPFLYAVIDLEANLPIFIGTMSYIK